MTDTMRHAPACFCCTGTLSCGSSVLTLSSLATACAAPQLLSEAGRTGLREKLARDEEPPRLVQQLCEFQVLAALLQLAQRLQELHRRGDARQVALAHHVLDDGPHVQSTRRRLRRRRQRRPSLPLGLCLHANRTACTCRSCLEEDMQILLVSFNDCAMWCYRQGALLQGRGVPGARPLWRRAHFPGGRHPGCQPHPESRSERLAMFPCKRAADLQCGKLVALSHLVL